MNVFKEHTTKESRRRYHLLNITSEFAVRIKFLLEVARISKLEVLWVALAQKTLTFQIHFNIQKKKKVKVIKYESASGHLPDICQTSIQTDIIRIKEFLCKWSPGECI